MKKIIPTIVFNINPRDFTSCAAAVNYIDQLNKELYEQGFIPEVVPASVPSSIRSSTNGPLVAEWCKVKKVSRVRCTEGRTPEQQAEYNLRHYLGYNDQQINAIKETSPVVEQEEEFSEPKSGQIEEDESEIEEEELI